MEEIKKKRGRPSKADILAREQAKVKEENIAIKPAATIHLQNEENIGDDEDSTGEIIGIDKISPIRSLVEVPIFKYDDRVRLLEQIVDGSEPKYGYVQRHDSDSNFVFVRWKDGSADWRIANVLIPAPKNKLRKNG